MGAVAADALTADRTLATRPATPALLGFRLPDGLLIGDGAPVIPETFHPSADPRAAFVLQPRDLYLLGLLGWCRELPGDIAHPVTFGTSASVFSRRLGILERERLLYARRFMGVAHNQIRLAPRGRDFLVEHGVMDEADIFVPRDYLPPKDMTHHYLVAETALLLKDNLPVRWDAVFPSWLLQRRVRPTLPAIADVLALRASATRPPGRIWAYEIDLGGERMKTLLTKLTVLAGLLHEWVAGGDARIFILTRGVKRRAALEGAIAAAALPVSVIVAVLPRETGRAGFLALRSLLSPPAKPISQGERV